MDHHWREIKDMEESDNDIRMFFKRWPRFYYFIANVFGPVMFTGLGAKKFLNKYPSADKKLNLGSGPTHLADDVINVDAHPYKGVDVLADIKNLPFENDSVSRIVLDNVIEHVRSPQKVLEEIKRTLSIGGLAYICMPFIYPFHASPEDHFRWTKMGFIGILKDFDFEIVEVGVRAGPISALTTLMCYLVALLFSFGNRRLYLLIMNLCILIFFPIKLLDLIFARLPNASDLAAEMYYVVRKK
ncbi:MAG: hypothetical protein HW405_748 [Candidatus Berkelbacteria bacterium]|nr:hypothetical protein [Candidatus Berkelbacteria bacterium]